MATNMDQTKYIASGMQLSSKSSMWAKKLVVLLSVTFLALPTAGCLTTTGTTATIGTGREANTKARCAGWRSIEFDAWGDTPETINQIRQHNRVGSIKRCWK